MCNLMNFQQRKRMGCLISDEDGTIFTPELLQRWDELIANNLHSKVLAEIANLFSMESRKNFFTSLDEKPYLTTTDYFIRHDVACMMKQELKEMIVPELYEKISKFI